VIEAGLFDRGAVNLGDGVARYTAAAGRESSGGGEGAQSQEKTDCLGHEKVSREGVVDGERRGRVAHCGWRGLPSRAW
jgi:hypothetical protein